MPTLALKAHFDGEKIVLDENYNLPMNKPLIVTLLPDNETDPEEMWLRAAASSSAFAFLADPAEDVYTLEDGIPIRFTPARPAPPVRLH